MAQTEEQLQLAEAGAKDLGFESVAEAKDTLSTETLQDTPDFQVKDSDVPTAGAGLEGAIEAETDAFTENLKQQREDAQVTKEESQTEIQDILSQIRGETGLTIEAENKAGVPEVEKELLDINQQIRTEQQALRRQIERIEDNEAGLFGGAVSDKAEEAKRSSLRKQADLSVIQMGIQGRYDSAKAIADRAVNAQMERQEIILNTAMFNYQENKELFTTAEQREFEALASKRERELNAERDSLQTLSDTKLDLMKMASGQGAPTSVLQAIQSAETPEEAIMGAGRYGTDILAQALKQRQYNMLGIEMDAVEQAKIEAEKAKESGVLTPEQYKIATDLRTEYNNKQEVKDAKDLESNTASIISALDQENGVGDISAINTFQRLVVDPGVAVREGDVALLQSAQSYGDMAWLRAQGLVKGDKLTPQARQQMEDLVKDVYRIRVELVDRNTEQIKTLSKEQNIDFGKYVGRNFQTYEQLQANIDGKEDLVFQMDTSENTYLDSIVETIATDPNANPFGVNMQ